MSTSDSPSPDHGRIVHEIQWSEALPWWILFRAAGSAFAPTVILLALLGSLATWAGWSIADSLKLAGGDPAVDAILDAELAGGGGGGLVLPAPGGAAAVSTALMPSRQVFPAFQSMIARLPGPVTDLVRLLGIPFRPSASLVQMGGALARLGWFVLVWSIFGTAITRHVALKLIGEEAPGLVGSAVYGARKWLAAFNSVAFVLLGIVALSIPGALLGLLMRTEWGLAFAGAVWPLVLAGAVVLAILAIGVVAGWPLMVAAVGVERGDSFQAISTAFSYLYQRPLHYAFYALVATAVAVPALAAAGLFADATSTLALWAASFGMGHERTTVVLEGVRAAAAAPTATDAAWGVRALGFWSRGLESLLGSFGWGYFWAIATAAYMLLRHDVDGTELDEVVIDEPGTEAA
jgi:hypothetical protein